MNATLPSILMSCVHNQLMTWHTLDQRTFRLRRVLPAASLTALAAVCLSSCVSSAPTRTAKTAPLAHLLFTDDRERYQHTRGRGA